MKTTNYYRRYAFFVGWLFLCFNLAMAQQPATKKAFHAWAAEPPMGWNSWDCYGPTVTEGEVKANADFMAANLKKFGWEYVVVDIRWYVGNDKAHGYNEKDAIYSMDDNGRFIPAEIKFPSSANGQGFKPLADYIHQKGLKFGIHIMRGIPKIAVERALPILGTNVTAKDISNKNEICTWLRDMYTVDATKPGAQEYYNSLFDMYASWGLDFVKVDDLSRPYHQDEIELIRKAIDRTGRKIVLSTSPGETPIAKASHVSQNANMWRVIDDFWDSWAPLKEHFDIYRRWTPYITPGAWPDGDMLPLGHLAIRAERGKDRKTAFTPDEQYTLMSLWSIARSPLIFGGDLPTSDEFTIKLITNAEVLAVNKKSTNNHELFAQNGLYAWVADEPKSGDKYLALFNAQDPNEITPGKALWNSGPITKETPGQSVFTNISIDGASKLYLAVSDNNDGNGWDYADWIAPILYNAKDTLLLTSQRLVRATAGWGRVMKNKCVSGSPLVVNDVEYANGLGTHANSVLEFNIPAGYTRFASKAGIDKAGATQNAGATMQFMVFTQNPAGEQPADSSKITVKLADLGFDKTCKVRDLWKGADKGTFTGEFATFVRRHGAGLYRISKK
jgi:alpha-galactosidase